MVVTTYRSPMNKVFQQGDRCKMYLPVNLICRSMLIWGLPLTLKSERIMLIHRRRFSSNLQIDHMTFSTNDKPHLWILKLMLHWCGAVWGVDSVGPKECIRSVPGPPLREGAILGEHVPAHCEYSACAAVIFWVAAVMWPFNVSSVASAKVVMCRCINAHSYWCLAPAVSNSLLKTVLHSDSVTVFKSQLQVFSLLFSLAHCLAPAPPKLQHCNAIKICVYYYRCLYYSVILAVC